VQKSGEPLEHVSEEKFHLKIRWFESGIIFLCRKCKFLKMLIIYR
jgi:hypothetical protein